MTRPLLRTFLTSAASGAGLWAVAAGFLTHHPMAVKIGAAVAVAGALLMLSGPAEARELSPHDLRQIEAINQARNHDQFGMARKGVDGLCAYFATSKAADLIQAGYGAETALAIVLTERGERHEVAEVFGTRDGHPTTIVLDIRTPWTSSRKDMEALGYRWIAEFEPANHPTENDR